jgi:hypothetical protein
MKRREANKKACPLRDTHIQNTLQSCILLSNLGGSAVSRAAVDPPEGGYRLPAVFC